MIVVNKTIVFKGCKMRNNTSLSRVLYLMMIRGIMIIISNAYKAPYINLDPKALYTLKIAANKMQKKPKSIKYF